MLQSFINWNDIYKSSAIEKVKVDLDKMVWMFKKKKTLSYQGIKYRGNLSGR